MQDKQVKENDKMMKTIKFALNDAERQLNNYHLEGNHFYSKFKMEISSNFARVVDVLRKQEEGILLELDRASESRKKFLVAYRRKLKARLEEISKDSTTAHSTEDVIDVLFENTSDVKLEFDDKMVDSLRNYCTLKLTDCSSVNFDSMESEFQGAELNAFDSVSSSDSTFECDASSEIREKRESVSLSCDVEERLSDERLTPPSSSSCDRFIENDEYSVCLCHVNNPAEFFLIRSDDIEKRNRLEHKLKTLSVKPPEKISNDAVYLAKYKAREKCYRVKVIKTLSNESGILMVRNLDYGTVGKITVSGLRSIPEDLSREPAMAIKCTLFHRRSPNPEQWSAKSIKFMKSLLNCIGTMVVIKIHPDCLEVDLKNIRSTDRSWEKKVSLRRHVMSLELCRLTMKKEENHDEFSVKSYPNQILPSPGQIVEVVISHVNSPFHFYVQDISQLDRLQELSDDLQKYYSNSSAKGFVYNPKIGMPCASLFFPDGKWYRGKIVGFPKKNYIRIFYVDFGNEETVYWKSVKNLEEDFIYRLSPSAFACEMADLEERDQIWIEKTKNYLKLNIQRGVHRMEILNINKIKSTLQVALYGKVKNKMDVEGCFSFAAEQFRNVTNRLKPLHQKETLSSGGSNDEGSTFSDLDESTSNQSSQGEVSRSRENNEVKYNDAISESSAGSDIINSRLVVARENAETEIFRPKIEIVAVNSPSLIYVTFPDLVGELSKLQTRLNEFYGTSQFQITERDEKKWNIHDQCVVYCSEKKRWFRCVILRFVSGNEVEVFFHDVGATAVKHVSSLRLLDESFSNYPIYTFKCHMSDVWPVGESWPDVTCEFLSSEIENFKDIYMTKNGSVESTSLPVELWVRKTVVGTGLDEPEDGEWISLNRLLVDRGLALPVVRCAASVSSAQLENSLFDLHMRNGLEKIARLMNESCLAQEKCSKRSERTLEWPAPVPFKRSTFIGIPTFVDADGVIYLHDADDDGKLKEIQETLALACKSGVAPKEKFQWTPGEPCTAKYHFDDFWYRGKVVKANEDSTFDVAFVDYGNIETCETSDLRESPLGLMNIPILSHKVILRGIRPLTTNGTERLWSDFIIDMLHSAIVDKKCQVTIWEQSPDPSQPSPASLNIMENGTNVSLFLQSRGVAMLQYE